MLTGLNNIKLYKFAKNFKYGTNIIVGYRNVLDLVEFVIWSKRIPEL